MNSEPRQYQTEQQLVVDAVRMLKAERDEAVEGIRLGLADAAAGRTQPLAVTFSDIPVGASLRKSSLDLESIPPRMKIW